MRLADLRGRSVAVWGTGREGRAAVTAIAKHEPSRLIAVDDSPGYLDVNWEGEFSALAPLAGGEHAFAALASAEVVVRSPGVPQTHPYLKELRARKITVTGGSALWMAANAARTVGVTGSKGKSTTSSLISHLLAAVGRPNAYGGNIGIPLLDLPASDLYVLELSSYQCADLTDSPRVAVVTSLFPEHPGVRETERTVIGVHGSPKPPPTRISLTLPAIRSAREVWLLAAGEDKANAVAMALSGAGEIQAPAAGAYGRARTLWLLDTAAAARLPKSLYPPASA